MNFLKEAERLFERMWRRNSFTAEVTGTSGNLVTIRRIGRTTADTQSYPKLASYGSPIVDDEVWVVRRGKGWLVTGKVVR